MKASEVSFESAGEGEEFVFGSKRPGHPSRRVSSGEVADWISFMRKKEVEAVCCLLSPQQLDYYESDLLAQYRTEFGEKSVCHAPVEDYFLCPQSQLTEKIIPFLNSFVMQKKKVLVHCSGGSGRTGHVLAGWLAASRGYSPKEAILEVEAVHRNPKEAVNCGNATQAELDDLLTSAFNMHQDLKSRENDS